MKYAIAFSLLLAGVALQGAAAATALAEEEPPRGPVTAELAIVLDYAADGAYYSGTIWTHPNPEGYVRVPDLGSGFNNIRTVSDRQSRPGNDIQWSVDGHIDGAHIYPPDADGRYHLVVDRFVLQPGDDVTLYFPFTNVVFSDVAPPPSDFPWHAFAHNLAGLHYTVPATGNPVELKLDVPVIPIRKDIHLNITPFLGEMWFSPSSDSFGVSGTVTFEHLFDTNELQAHCEPAGIPLGSGAYRDADLLFALDWPARGPLNMGLLANVYSSKPTALLLHSHETSCETGSAGGLAQATFQGRAFSPFLRVDLTTTGSAPVEDRSGTLRSPWQEWSNEEKPEHVTLTYNSSVKLQDGTDAYRLNMGDVVLGPGDVLTIASPDMKVLDIAPPPTSRVFGVGKDEQITFEGPSRFAVSITYKPSAELVYRQFPATVGTLVERVPATLATTGMPLTGGRFLQSTWLLGGFGVLLLGFAIGLEWPARARTLMLTLGWCAVGLTALYVVRNAFGLLLVGALAIVLHVPWTTSMLRGGIVVGVVAAGIYVDQLAAQWLSGSFIEIVAGRVSSGVPGQIPPLPVPDVSPLTPLVLLALLGAVSIAALIRSSAMQWDDLLGRVPLALIMILTAFAVFDVLMKSLLSLALIGAALVYLMRRMRAAHAEMTSVQILRRLRVVLNPGCAATALLILVLTVQIGSADATTNWGPVLGPLADAIAPLIVTAATLDNLVAIGLLFLILYPVLPFSPGYLKAACFGVFFSVVFLFGLGGSLLVVGAPAFVMRLIYYMVVPLSLVYFRDMEEFVDREVERQRRQAKAGVNPVTRNQLRWAYNKRRKSLLRAAWTLLTALSPALAVAVSGILGQPVVAGFLQVLQATSSGGR